MANLEKPIGGNEGFPRLFDLTFGLKLARFYAEFERNLARLKTAKKEIAVCAISGAVGTFANVDPFVQKYVAEKMGLADESVSS